MKIKRAVQFGALGLGALLLTLQPKIGMMAALRGLSTWAMALVPALFPYCFLAISLERLGLGRVLGKRLGWLMRIFGCPENGAGALICGWVGGNPTGAKLTAICAESGSATPAQYTRLALLCSACSPAFALGAMENALPGCGWTLLVSCWLGLLAGGIIMRFVPLGHTPTPISDAHKPSERASSPVSRAALPALEATQAMLMIGCWVVLMSVLSAYMYWFALLIDPNTAPAPLAFAHALLEMAGGSLALSELPARTALPLISFALTFGGMSIGMQALSFLKSAGVSGTRYMLGKALQGALAALICRVMIGAGVVEAFAQGSGLKFSELGESQTIPALITLGLGIVAAIMNRRYIAYCDAQDKNIKPPA